MGDKNLTRIHSTVADKKTPTVKPRLIKSLPYKTDWKKLPFDESIHSISKRTGCSRTLVRNALIALDGDGADSLYKQICFPEHKRPTLTPAEVEEHGDPSKDTHPADVFWEATDLICALVEARKEDCKLQQDALAKQAYRKLAKTLTESNLHAAERSFVTTQMLYDPFVRTELSAGFYSEINLRIRALKYLTRQIPADFALPNIYEACQTMDALFLNMLHRLPLSNLSLRNIPEPSVEDFRRLYTALTNHRKKITKYDSNEENVEGRFTTVFKLPSSKRGTRIIRKLTLASTLYPHKLQNTYEQYLLATIPKSNRKVVKAFSLQFQKMSKYTNQRNEFDTIIDEIQKSLCKMVTNIFTDLNQNNIIPYPFAEFNASSIDNAYISRRLENVHQQIMVSIHTSLTRIVHARILIFYKAKVFSRYPYSDAEDSLVCDLFKALMDARDDLARRYKKLPLGTTVAQISPEKFVSCYHNTVFIQLDTPPSVHTIKKIISRLPDDNVPKVQPYWALDSLHQLLLYSCHIVACYEAKKGIRNLKQEHSKLKFLYNK